jgi:beta-glucosidase
MNLNNIREPTMNLKMLFFSCMSLAMVFCTPCIAEESNTVEQRIRDLIGKMTLEEKIDLLSGTGFETRPIPRLGIPPLNMTDGPVGVRWDSSTAFPVSIAMAATWDPGLIHRVGWALGREVKAKGRHMLLGPCININRVPHGGRNFESFGEDPYLTSRIAVSYVEGVQSEKVVACAKHFACNNQEWERATIDAKVDERTLREIYLPAFRAAVQEGGAWTVMSAYNRLNGYYCSENHYLLTDVLKNDWQFKGFVVSDWGAVHSTVPTANAGLDLEMPLGEFLGADLLAAAGQGQVKESTLDDKITRLLRVMFWAGLFDGPQKTDPGVVNCKEHQTIARDVAQAGIVLLKNENSILPLNRAKVKSIAIIGPNAAVARTGGGGSSQVFPYYAVSPLEGLRAKVRSNITLRYAMGCRIEGDISPIESSALRPPEGAEGEYGLKGEYFDNRELNGEPAFTRIDKQVDFEWGSEPPAPGVPAHRFSVRWTGKLVPTVSALYEVSVMSDDGARMYLDGKLVIDNWRDHAAETRSYSMKLEAGKSYQIRLEFYENEGSAVAKLGWNTMSENLLADAVEAARSSDVAVVFAGLNNQMESEGFDRENLELPAVQNDLIEAVVRANKNTIVVLTTGAPVLMSKWIDKIPALVEAWFPGQEGGNAIAEVLFGDVNPSGKLPVTFLKRWEDSPAFGSYPGSNGETRYEEGIFVGYRHFDTKNIEPLFPFGHGLSYTNFTYDNLKVTPTQVSAGGTIKVSLDVKNTGSLKGAEVVQLYVRDLEASVPRPTKELKGFSKVSLKPGEKKQVVFTVDKSSLAFYDVTNKGWTVEPGKFELLVGSSSRDIRVRRNIEVK